MEKVEKKASSYLDSIGANREAIGYDQEQVGLAHEQEVAPENNWGDDKRDAVGRAASLQNKRMRLAKKLVRISREIEALGKMEEAYKSEVEEMQDGSDDYDEDDKPEEGAEKAEKPEAEKPEAGSAEEAMKMEMGQEEWLDATVKDASAAKEARHPLMHPADQDDPEAFRSSQMGDEEWISIGTRDSGAWGHDVRDVDHRPSK
jgi:hypothetical protein